MGWCYPWSCDKRFPTLGESQKHACIARMYLHLPQPSPEPGLSWSPAVTLEPCWCEDGRLRRHSPIHQPREHSFPFLWDISSMRQSGVLQRLRNMPKHEQFQGRHFFFPPQCILCKDLACSTWGCLATGGR